MRPLALLLALGAALVATLPAPSAKAWCRMTTSPLTAAPGDCITDGIPLAWRTRCTSYRFFNYASGMTTADVEAAAALSFGAWHDITCPDGAMPMLEVHEGPEMSQCDRAEYNTSGGNVGMIAFLDGAEWSARMNPAAAYAITTVWHSTRTGDIYDVDMELNEARGPYTVCPDSGCPDTSHVDLRDVMTHEAGHWFGMAHSAVFEATMYFAAPPGETAKRSLEADDVAGFCDGYGHATLGTTCDDTPRGGLKLTCGPSHGCCTVVHARTDANVDAATSTALALGVAAVFGWRRRRGATR